MNRPTRWYQRREPISFEIPTADQPHRLRWVAGRLQLLDHDVGAEEVLIALGGEPCPCLLVRDVFRGRLGVPLAGTPAPARPGVPFGPVRVPSGPTFQSGGLIIQAGNPPVGARALRIQGGPGSTPTAEARRPGDAWRLLQSLGSQPSFRQMPPEARERLLGHLRVQVLKDILPGPLADLMKEIGELRWRRRNEREPAAAVRPDPNLALVRAAESAVRETVRRSRADLRSYGVLTITCSRLGLAEAAWLEGRVGKFGGSVNVGLATRWLNRVWRRGIANVEGYLVLEVDAAAPASFLRGRAVRWERSHTGADSVPAVAECVLRRTDGVWHLSWC